MVQLRGWTLHLCCEGKYRSGFTFVLGTSNRNHNNPHQIKNSFVVLDWVTNAQGKFIFSFATIGLGA